MDHLWLIFLPTGQFPTVVKEPKSTNLHDLLDYHRDFCAVSCFLKVQGVEINMVRNGAEVVGVIERLCFSSRSELLMSCGIP